MTHHPRSTRSWTAVLPLLAISAAILLVLVAVVMLRPGRSPVAVVASRPSPTPTVTAASIVQASPAPESASSPSPSPKPSERPTPTPDASTPTACKAKHLSGRILGWDGAAGSRIAEIELRNTGAIACTLGTPTAVRLVDADGTMLIDSSTIAGAPADAPDEPPITVAPGASIRTEVRVANYCGASPETPIGVSLSLPRSGGAVVAMPATGVSSADAVPPCNGPIGPDIEMNGWRQ